MFSIDGSTISLTRGDTLCLNITLYRNGEEEEYVPASTDTIQFALKKNSNDNTWLILKEVHPDSQSRIILELVPADTKPLSFGTYRYDIALIDEHGRTYTFQLGDFKITEEVY